jgi:hypothetical protein
VNRAADVLRRRRSVECDRPVPACEPGSVRRRLRMGAVKVAVDPAHVNVPPAPVSVAPDEVADPLAFPPAR